ncbi:MAG: sensor domain-containing diguanylate cyclase [Alphaproteobacteria bacterium]
MADGKAKKASGDDPPALRERIAQVERENEDLRRVNSDLKERTLELFSLFELSTALGTGVRFDRMVGDSMDFLGELLGIRQFSLQIYDPDDKKLYIQASLGIPKEARKKCVITPPEGVAGHVFSSGQAMHIPDVTREPRYLYYQGYNMQGGSLLSIPLLDDDMKPFGVLNISKPEAHAFTDNDLSLYSTVALQLAAVIQNYYSYLRLRDLSLTDELTGVNNRRAFFDLLEEEHERHQRYEKSYTLLLIDVDFFKRYNDRHGHLEGDKALVTLAETLSGRLRASDVICRYGGEEFGVIAVETAKEEGVKLAESLREEVVKTRFTLSSGEPASELSITIGVASYPADGRTHIEVLDRADKALYYGKSRGRNTVSTKVPIQQRMTAEKGAKGDKPGRRGKGTSRAAKRA